MTAETAPQPEEQVRAQIGHQELARYGIVLAAVVHMLLHDRRFHAAVITSAIGTYALVSVIKNNQARPVRRSIHWYGKLAPARSWPADVGRPARSWPAQVRPWRRPSAARAQPARTRSNGTGWTQLRG